MKALTLTLLALLVATGAQAKQGRSFYTDEVMAQVRRKMAQHEWARRQVVATREGCAWVLEMPDQELWDFVPPPEQARALNVRFGADCPVHGAQIHRAGGHYPWGMSRERPFKVKCPVGGEEYPSNDFQPWNLEGAKGKPETGPGFVDKGIGWQDAGGRRYWFVAHYIFWQRWQRDILPAIRSLANAYLLTGEPVYAHKCALLLARIAGDYERFDYPTQAYHNGAWPAGIGGRILDYIWETGTINSFARAYDAIFPALTADADLQAFLKGKGIEDAQAHIERKMLHVMARDIMRGFIRGNAGMHQDALATLAIVLPNDDPAQGPTTAQMRDWLMLGGGEVEDLLWNGFYRDGHGGESSPGYSSGWCTHFYQIASLLPRMGVDIWSNPKLKKMADIGLDLTLAGAHCPSIGDCGSILGAGRVGWSAVMQGPGFRHYQDPRHARALALMNARDENLFDDYVDEEGVDAVVKREGADLALSTRNLGGYGLAILESGAGEKRRAVSLYYGHAGGGHGHLDRLTLEMVAFGRPMLTDMGYPAHWLPKATYWTNNTISHYGVVVDQSGQRTAFPGHLNTLASCPGLQLMDASAEEVAYPGVTSLYRRTTAMVDISPDAFYLLDLFRTRGGRQHDWSFHGPPFPEFSVGGAAPGPVQAKGTLAGEDVAFGEVSTRSESGEAAVTLSKGEGALADRRPYDQRSLEGWATYSGDAVLTRKAGAAMSFAVPRQPSGKVKVLLRVHDYNLGVNEVDVTLGDATRTLRWEPSGTVGSRWIGEVFDLGKPAERLILTARRQGQSYLLIYNLALSRNLDATEPSVADLRGSGFQYLSNARRMRPQGGWSATWRKPDEDLALTLTMPAGCAGEVILADAEPELKPGSPKTLQYVLGRNTLARGKDVPKDGLASTYAAVVEPHRGPALVTAVERLKTAGAPEWAVGLDVRRGAERDLIHSSLDPAQACEWQTPAGTLKVAGEFALVTLDAAGVKRAYLVNGTHLSLGSLVLDTPASPSGKVTGVDFRRNTVTVDAALPSPAACKGKVVLLGNERHQTSYTIRGAAVAGGRTTLEFGDTLFVVGAGKVDATEGKAGAVVTSTQLTGYGRVDGGRHAGRWLYNEEKSRGFRIRALEGNRILLEGAPADLDAAFQDADGDGRRRFWISDIGPGDLFRLPLAVHLARRP